MANQGEIKELLEEFFELLNELEDNIQNASYFTRFLRKTFTVNKEVLVPSVEIMTILKYEKPRIFHYLKNQFGDLPLANVIFRINLDFEQAKERLNVMMNSEVVE